MQVRLLAATMFAVLPSSALAETTLTQPIEPVVAEARDEAIVVSGWLFEGTDLGFELALEHRFSELFLVRGGYLGVPVSGAHGVTAAFSLTTPGVLQVELSGGVAVGDGGVAPMGTIGLRVEPTSLPLTFRVAAGGFGELASVASVGVRF